ncbi:MAG: endonuclease III [Candidatus Nezhaarchaeales archaeon]
MKNELLNVLRRSYEDVNRIAEKMRTLNSFELLLSTIISQNTNWRNVERAMENMRRKGLVHLNGILSADIAELEDALRVSGLYRVKALRIKEIAEIIKTWNTDLDGILSMSFEDARTKLMELPAVGYKTADVMLAFKARAPVIPIDTHIRRVAERLGLVDKKASYEEIRLTLESFVPPEERDLFHLALIKFGREICRARDPACSKCPLNSVCMSRRVKP